MDICDRAQEYEELFITTALRKATIGRASDDSPLYIAGVRCCIDCEDPIPEERIEAKPDVARCVECQEKYEKGMP